jgi:hypothetical protein
MLPRPATQLSGRAFLLGHSFSTLFVGGWTHEFSIETPDHPNTVEWGEPACEWLSPNGLTTVER